MSVFEIVLIALGLAMDAFAVSITLGLSVEKPSLKEMIIPGLYFGSFQAIMPATGYVAGILFAQKIQNMDHWIAFVLLGFIGGKMIKDSLSKEPKENEGDGKAYSFHFVKMLVLAFATSVDALAVGVTFAFFEVNIVMAAAVIGVITLLISICGVKIGNIFGTKFRSKAEFAGGSVLVLLGVKIVVEHLFFP